MRTASSLVRGSIFRTIDLLTAIGASLWMTPIVVHSLGNRMYGFWTLFGTFLGYYGLLDFGLSSAAGRYLSQALGREDNDELQTVANTAFFLFCLVGAAALLVTAVCLAASPLVVRSPEELTLFRRILVLLGISTAVGFPVRAYGAIFESHLRYDYISYIDIARTIVMNVGIYYALRAGGGIMSLAVVSFTANMLDYFATYSVCCARYPHIRIRFMRYEKKYVHAMVDHGWKIFIAGISEILRFRIDTVVIAAFLGVSLVTPYAIGTRLVDGFKNLIMSSIGMMQPVFARYDGRGDYDAMRSALLKVTKISAILAGYVGFSIIFYAKAMILRWMGPGFEGSYYVTAILTAAIVLELSSSPGVQLLIGLSKHEAYAALNSVEAVLNVVLSIILLHYYCMYGVVLGTAIEIALIKLFVMPIYICRVAHMPVRAYLVDSILATFVKIGIPLGVYFYLVRGFVRPDYLRLTECVAVQTCLLLPVAFFFILDSDERRLCLSYVEGRMMKRAEAVRPSAPADVS